MSRKILADAIEKWRALGIEQRNFIIVGVDHFEPHSPRAAEAIDAALDILRAAAEPESDDAQRFTKADVEAACAIACAAMVVEPKKPCRACMHRPSLCSAHNPPRCPGCGL
jgi:hypothetical protein